MMLMVLAKQNQLQQTASFLQASLTGCICMSICLSAAADYGGMLPQQNAKAFMAGLHTGIYHDIPALH